MGVIVFILVLFFIYVVCSLLGWGAKLLDVIFDFLAKGFSSFIGCLFWVFILNVFLMAFL